MAVHWEYLRLAVYTCAASVGMWRYVWLTVVRLMAVFTNSEQRNRQCMEVLRLARRDASAIPSYLPNPRATVRADRPGRIAHADW